MEVLDEAYEPGTHDTTLTRVYSWERRPAGSYRVRVTVRRNSYQNQSYARAEVLTPDLTWTHLVDSPTRVWWEAANSAHHSRLAPDDEQTILEEVSLLLADRAAKVLP